MDTRVLPEEAKSSKIFYGWVIVAAGSVLLAFMAGIVYSYGVFFKPLAGDFGWNRATTAGVYSSLTLLHGFFSIPSGWLVDRFGPAKVMAVGSFLAGLGLILSSRITAIWQLYLTFGVVVAIGLSTAFPTCTATTARWFVRRRGLALGIVAGGIGLGTLILVPLAERLVAAFGWSKSYSIIGIATWAVMIPSALLLRRSPAVKPKPVQLENNRVSGPGSPGVLALIKAAASHKPLWMLAVTYFLFNFCVQMVMCHLVNRATDLGITSLVAATFVSIVGISSFLGRLTMGTASDRIGTNNALLICCATLSATLLLLLFAKQVWMFYLFSAMFGFSYGGEVPQIPSLIDRYFGLRAVAALVGVVLACSGIGGALGSWLGGRVFDITQTYQVAFIVALTASLFSMAMALLLKKMKPVFSD